MKKGEEAIKQETCVAWFRYQYPDFLLWSIPNEATYRNKNYFNMLGMMKGVSDLVCVLPNRILFIEMKSDKGRQSPDQKIFQKKVENLGFKYYICRSLEDFQELIKTNLN